MMQVLRKKSQNTLTTFLSKTIATLLLTNKANQGFVKTVNRGMRYSNEDIVILNSDTIVTKNWLKRLVDCAYSSILHATVTPFSNNATICSIPKFLEDNKIPDGFSIKTFAQFVNEVSRYEYPEIPTGVGFCMYIKRKAINIIGYFDDETFGKGYGEENDFCMSVLKRGFKNILCDNTFVYHKGGQSFKESTLKLMKENSVKLAKKHPEYFVMVKDFITNNPIEHIHKRINVNLFYNNINKLKNILLITHVLGGGTEKHIDELISNLGNRFNFYVFYLHRDYAVLVTYKEKKKIPLKIQFDKSTKDRISLIKRNWFYGEHYKENISYKNTLYKILNTFSIDIVHIHHFIGYPLNTIKIFKEYNIPVFITIHDFYTVCPTINMLNNKNTFCNANTDNAICNSCIKYLGDKYLNIEEWRYNFNEIFHYAKKIFVPSSFAKNNISKYYNYSKKVKIIPHGINIDTYSIDNSYKIKHDKENFNIAFVGAIGIHKGREIMYELVKQMKKQKNINWHLIGYTDNKNRDLSYQSKYNFTLHGSYTKDELYGILKKNKIQLIILPSIVPETFSYTLTEAWLAGIPVLVNNIGALKERVEENKGGWIVDIYNIEQVQSKILSIINNPQDYYKTLRNIENIEIDDTKNIVNKYVSEYLDHIDYSKTNNNYNTLKFNDDEIYQMMKDYTCDDQSVNVFYSKVAGFFTRYKIIKYINRYIPRPLKVIFLKTAFIINHLYRKITRSSSLTI